MNMLLFSGGLDSLCLYALCNQPVALYVLLGHRYQPAELEAIRELAMQMPQLGARLMVVQGADMSGIEEPDAHIRHRNLALAVTAAQCGGTTINYGALLGEASPDKSGKFIRATSRALTASEGRRVQLVAPARKHTKAQLVARTLRELPTVPWRELFAITRSCYDAPVGDAPCGKCQACFRRHVALWHNDLALYPPSRPDWFEAGTARRNLRRMHVGQLFGAALNNAEALLAIRGVQLYTKRRPA